MSSGSERKRKMGVTAGFAWRTACLQLKIETKVQVLFKHHPRHWKIQRCAFISKRGSE